LFDQRGLARAGETEKPDDLHQNVLIHEAECCGRAAERVEVYSALPIMALHMRPDPSMRDAWTTSDFAPLQHLPDGWTRPVAVGSRQLLASTS
jgi:hypothetical protein